MYLGIATAPAKAILSNGENAHCTIQPISWWVNQVELYAPKDIYTHIKTYGNDNNYEILNEEIYLEWFLQQV